MTTFGDDIYCKTINGAPVADLATTTSLTLTGKLTSVGLNSGVGTAPASATAAGTAGDIVVVSGFIYVCVTTGAAGAAAWQRVAIATWGAA